MEENELLKVLNSWNFWSRKIDTGISRDFYAAKVVNLLKDPGAQIAIETGVRRAGKSFIAKQAAKKMINDGLDRSKVLIINLEDERLTDRNYSLLLGLYEAYKKSINPDSKSVIIIDEAQEVDGWERFVRGISERGEAKFIITGSSSKLLDSEYATLLSGRHVVVYVHPLNLIEYKKFDNAGKLNGYLTQGGFPAIALSSNKADLASSYFNTIIVKDVIQRFRIQKQETLIRLAKFYATSVGSRITYNSIAKFLKLPVKTVYNFSSYLEKAYLVFFVDRFSFSIKTQDNSPRKVYTIDNAFPSMLGLNPAEIRGRLLENMVAGTLYMISRHVPDFHFYYWHESSREVDFVIRDGGGYEIVQVAYAINSEKTRNREVEAIIECAPRLNADHAEIITNSYSHEELVNGIHIKYTPAEDWIEKKLRQYKFY